MTYAFEPVRTPVEDDLLIYRLRVEFGSARLLGARAGGKRPDAASYRAAVAAEVMRAFGCPTPSELNGVIEEGRDLGAPVGDLVGFIGRQFRLKPLRSYSNISN